ncbi:putative structural protein [Salmonella phage SPFM20]|nr:putative structural protein [Salmonella phage SPFM20]
MYTSYPSGWLVRFILFIPDHTTASLDITFTIPDDPLGLYLLYKEHGAGHDIYRDLAPTTDNGQAFGFYTGEAMRAIFTVTDIPGKAINGAWSPWANCTVDGLDRIMDMGMKEMGDNFTAHMCALWIAGSAYAAMAGNHTPNEFPTAPNKPVWVENDLVVYVENWAKWLVGFLDRFDNAAARCWYELVVRGKEVPPEWTTFHWGDGHPWAGYQPRAYGCAAYIWNRWDNYTYGPADTIRFMHDSQTNYQAQLGELGPYPFMYTIHTDDRYKVWLLNQYTEGTYQLGAWHGMPYPGYQKDYRLDSLAYCPGTIPFSNIFRIVIRGGSAFTGKVGDCTIWYCVNDVPPLFNGDDGWTLTTTIDQVTILPDSAVENAHFSSGYQPDHDTDVEPKPAAPNYLPATNGEWKQVIIRPEDATLADADFNFRFEDTDKWRWWWMIIGFWLTDAGVAPPQSIVYRYDGRSGTIVEALFPNDDAGFARACSDYGGCTWQEKFENNILGHLARMTNPANGEDYIIADWYGCTLPGSTSMEVEQHDIDLACKVMVDINPVKADTEEVNINSQSKLRVTYGGVCDNGDAVFRSEEAVQNFMEQQAVRFRDYKYPSTVEVAYSRDENGDIDKFFRRSKLAETPFTDGISYKAALDSVFYTAHEYTYIDAKEVWFIDACYLLWRITGEPRYRPVHTPLKGSVNQMGNAADASQVPVEHGGYLFDRNEPWHNKGTVQLKDTSINGVYLINYAWTGEKVQDGDVIESGLPDAQPMWGGSTSKGPRYEPDWFVVYDVKAWVDWNTMLNDPTGYTDGLIDWSKVPDYLIVNPEKPRGHPTWGAVNADVQKIKESEQIPQGAPFFGEYLNNFFSAHTEPTHGGYKCVPVTFTNGRCICNWLVNGKEPVLADYPVHPEAYATYYYAGQAIPESPQRWCHMYIATKNQMWLDAAIRAWVYQPNGDATTEGQSLLIIGYLINPEGVLSNNRHFIADSMAHQDFVRRNTGLTNDAHKDHYKFKISAKRHALNYAMSLAYGTDGGTTWKGAICGTGY